MIADRIIEEAATKLSQDEKLDAVIALIDDAIKKLEEIIRKNKEVLNGRR